MHSIKNKPEDIRNLKHCKTCLILSMRHLGDAVITAGFINALKKYNQDIEIDVLGRAELKEVTGMFCKFREYLPISFPIYGHHKKGISELTSALRQIELIRKRKYSYCINLVGDVRENLIGKLSGAERSIAPIWSKKNLFSHHIRTFGAPLFIDYGVEIPEDRQNIYSSIGYFCQYLGLDRMEWATQQVSGRSTRCPSVVAIHPGASQKSKRWLPQKWQAVMRRLVASGANVILLGSPAEHDGLLKNFKSEIEEYGLDVITGSLPIVLETLSRADVLVGMDSFSVHAAQAFGVPTIVLHGPFNPMVMTPPGGTPLSAGHLCGQFPCHNKPSCIGTDKEYICVRGIEVDAVVKAVEDRLSPSN